ncbi:hypothetical protein Dvina_29480 [Dactylosporangium vinaceum]|uniref:GNAT family N-acetyltransferase n=1 Tax=Dactylosporangium vinaceum TaxID=53362 RepID=A0ABV5ME78_9ACTN|nr:hypothetical protein [Dactylosporangium vinaceum]UAB92479.1 hypothetical protein Dvina_29480 [Dactylosporangium vinaceum]
MDRARLAELLETHDDRFAAGRLAVLGGARFRIDDGSTPAPRLASIYARRDRHTRSRGMATLGFAAAVEALRAYGDRPVRLGAVEVDEPPYHFQLFLAADLTAVIACLGVDRSAPGA